MGQETIALIENCIFQNMGTEILAEDGSHITVTFSNIKGGKASLVDPHERIVWGNGNIDVDPCFVDPGYWDNDLWVDGDYHLKSKAGRYDAAIQSWVYDDVTSPCIDAGNPVSPVGTEPFCNGGIVNMGAYGGTAEASKAVPTVTILYPNGGESLLSAQDIEIRWTSTTDCPDNVTLAYAMDTGTLTWHTIATVPNSGLYIWTRPTITWPTVHLRITDAGDPAISDDTDESFALYECRKQLLMDADKDCYVNLVDLAIMAREWLDCGNPFDPTCWEWADPDMILIPAGTFQMGDTFSEGYSDERPVHTVTLSSFYMSKYETTNGQYCEFLNSALSQGLIAVIDGIVYEAGFGKLYRYCHTSASSSYSPISYSGGIFSVRTDGGRDVSDDPMIRVNWHGAVAYCNWRSRKEGLEPCYDLSTWNCDFSKNGYHLPTEAQWEYAARGGLCDKRFPWGDTISHSQANYYSDGEHLSYDISPTWGHHPTWGPHPAPVGSFAASGYGLYDMVGNACEWCNDWYSENHYSSSPQNNPTGPTTGSWRVFRGGDSYSDTFFCRVAKRCLYSDLGPDDERFGFRVCR